MIVDSLLLIATTSVLFLGLVLGRVRLISALTIYSVLASTRFVMRPAFILFGLDGFSRPELVDEAPREAIWAALLVFLLGHICLLLGYLLHQRSLLRGTWLWKVALNDQVSTGRAITVCMVFFGINFAIWLGFLLQAGSLPNMVRLARMEFFEENVFLKSLPDGLITFGLYLLLVSLKPAIMNASSLRWVGGVSVVAGSFMMATYGDRSSVVMPFIVGFIAYHFAIRQVRGARMLLLGGAVFVTMGLLSMVRSYVVADGEVALGAVAQESGVARQATKALNLDIFDNFVVVIDRSDEIDLKMGEDFVNGFLGLVPRAIWAGKPSAITPGAWFRQRFLPDDRGGRPVASEGVWLINFGLPGVVIGLFLTGLILRELDLLQAEGVTVAQAIIVTSLIFRVFLGGFHSLMPIAVVRNILPILLLIWIVRGRAQRAPATIWPQRRAI